MQIEMNRPALAGRRPASRSSAERVPGTLSRRDLRRIVAEMVD
jgi:hypothetical protein